MKRYHKKIESHVKEMKNMANMCVDYTFPKCIDKDCQDVDFLKERIVFVDGYKVNLFFTKEEHKDYFFYQLQIVGIDFPFLPFALICKIAKAFYGKSGLELIEVEINELRSYSWQMVENKETKMPIIKRESNFSFGDMSFSYNRFLY